MKKLYSFIVLSFVVSAAAQTPFTKVFHNYDEATANSVVPGPDKSFIIAGNTEFAALLMKSDSSGNPVWVKRIGNQGMATERLYSVVRGKDSSYIAAGQALTGANYDALIIKTDENGDTLWVKKLDFGLDETAMQVTGTYDNSIVVAGYIYATAAPYYRAFAAKLDSAGNIQWGKTFWGANNSNIVYRLKETNDSCYLLGGSLINTSPNTQNGFLLKLSAAGSAIWSKEYQTSGSNCSMNDFIEINNGFACMLTDAQGTVFMKTDSAGNPVLTTLVQTFSANYLNEPSQRMVMRYDGSYIFSYEDGILTTDSMGNLSSLYTFSTNTGEFFETADHGILMAGNGPMFGVTVLPMSYPHIGVIKTDSMFNAPSCVFNSGGTSTSTYSVTSIAPSLAFQSGGSSANLSIQVDSTSLSTYNGCVDFFSGIEERSAAMQMSLFPNPANDIIKISSGDEITKAEVIDANGKTVVSFQGGNKNEIQLNISVLPAGFYIVKGYSQTGVATKKLFVTR